MDLTQYQTDKNGDKFTLDENGKWHSYNDKPSFIHQFGHKYWHKHGRLHRETGPSLIYSNGKEFYCLDGIEYSKEEWEKKVAELNKAQKTPDDLVLKEKNTQNINDLIQTMDKSGLIDRQSISDSYHTFRELYNYRMVYNALLFNEWAKQGLYDVHKSLRHYDGEECFGGGWFIVVAVLPIGQISNHYSVSDWDHFKVPVLEKAKYEYDGHTPTNALHRLLALTKDSFL